MAGQQRHRAATCEAAVPIPGEAKPKPIPGAAARAPSACMPLATRSARHPHRRSRGGAALAHGRRRGVPRRGSRGGLLAQGRRLGRRRSPTAAERDGWGGVPAAPGSSVGGRRSPRLRRPPPHASRAGRRRAQPSPAPAAAPVSRAARWSASPTARPARSRSSARRCYRPSAPVLGAAARPSTPRTPLTARTPRRPATALGSLPPELTVGEGGEPLSMRTAGHPRCSPWPRLARGRARRARGRA